MPIVINPMRIGGGLKNKGLEGLALRRLVIFNQLGIESISAARDVHYVHAERSEEFAVEIIKYLGDRADRAGRAAPDPRSLHLEPGRYQLPASHFAGARGAFAIGVSEDRLRALVFPVLEMTMGHAPVPSWRNASFVLDLVAVGLLAVVVRSFHTEHAPLYDELYHVLAARSWATEGSLAINDGVYNRGAYFTIMTGWMFERFGLSLTTARVVPIAAGSLLVLSLFLWTLSVAGRAAAWAAALLLCFSPNAIVLSQFIRPYSLHSLMFFWGAIGIYALVSAQGVWGWRRASLLLCSAASLFLALHLQVTTLIGLVGLTPWLAITLGPAWARRIERLPRYRLMVVVVLMLAVAGGIAVVQSGMAQHLLELARQQPLWAQGSKFHLYHWIFLKDYPIFWGLLPLTLLYSIARKGRPAVFCCSVFTVSLLLHLFFPIRGERYISYLMPFLFAIWGMVVAEVLPQVQAPLPRRLHKCYLPLDYRNLPVGRFSGCQWGYRSCFYWSATGRSSTPPK